jgi:polysaccharide biosynthesis transport protein
MDIQTTGRLFIFSLFKRQKMILQIIAAIMATIILGSLLLPPTFEAQSTVLVRGRTNQDLLTPSGRVDNNRTMMLNPKDEINSEIEIIKSRPVMEAVVKNLKLYDRQVYLEPGFLGGIRNVIRFLLRLPKLVLMKIGLISTPSEQEAIELAVLKLQRDLRVEPAPESMIIRLKLRDHDPEMASKIVNLVTENYLRQHMLINTNQGQSSFFAEQIDTVKGELKTLQDQLVKIKENTGLLSFSEQSRLLLKQLDTFEMARANINKDIIDIRAKVKKISDLRRTNPKLLIPLPEIAQDVQVQDLENKLINMRYQLNSVTKRYTDESRQVETATSQIKDLHTQIKKQVSDILERDLAKLKALDAERQGVEETIAGLKTEIVKLPAQEVALGNLSRDIETKQEALTILWKKYQDSIIAQNTDERLENIKVVSFAAIPVKPVSPKLWLNTLLGLVLATVVSFSVAFFLTHWDDTINLPEDVERYLNLPVCASIPEL